MSTGQLFDPSRSANYGYVVPAQPSPNLRTFLEYVDALSQIPCDLDRLFNCFDDSLEHRILPASLKRPVLTKRHYREYLSLVLPMFSSFKVTLHEVVETNNVLTVHASSNGMSVSGAPYTNEYMIVVHFIPAPPPLNPNTPQALPKMWLVKEFVDSSFSLKFFADERARQKEREAKKEQEEREAAAMARGRPGGW